MIMRPLPICKCEPMCNCGAMKTMKTYMQSNYVIRFVKGLNDNFARVKKSCILDKSLVANQLDFFYGNYS